MGSKRRRAQETKAARLWRKCVDKLPDASKWPSIRRTRVEGRLAEGRRPEEPDHAGQQEGRMTAADSDTDQPLVNSEKKRSGPLDPDLNAALNNGNGGCGLPRPF
jgi:hypothetical protein